MLPIKKRVYYYEEQQRQKRDELKQRVRDLEEENKRYRKATIGLWWYSYLLGLHVASNHEDLLAGDRVPENEDDRGSRC
jgi:hypothetical protein